MKSNKRKVNVLTAMDKAICHKTVLKRCSPISNRKVPLPCIQSSASPVRHWIDLQKCRWSLPLILNNITPKPYSTQAVVGVTLFLTIIFYNKAFN